MTSEESDAMSGKILVVDDVPTNRLVLRGTLQHDYYTIYEAGDGFQAIEIAEKERPDLILLDVNMPGIDGYETCLRLKSSSTTMNIPVVIVTANTDKQSRLRGLEVGADDFLTKPIDNRVLFGRVRNLVRVKLMLDELKLHGEIGGELSEERMLMNPFEKTSHYHGNILVACSDTIQAAAWREEIEAQLPVSVAITDNEGVAMDQTAIFVPDALIVTQNLAENGIGLRLVSWLQTQRQLQHSAVIFVASDGEISTGLRGLELGAKDFLLEPFDNYELFIRLRTQLLRKYYSDCFRDQMRQQLRLASIDPLTGLHNRRYARQNLPRLIETSARTGESFGVLMMDLDRFKNFNDTYGHDAGDMVLIEFAKRLRENLRAVDLLVRQGGEEFLAALPNVNAEKAQFIAERVRFAVESAPFSIGDISVPVTVSIGVSIAEPGDSDIERIIKNADQALYAAKEFGRNQVTLFAA